MTFTATPATEHNRATLEADSIASEQGKFLRINSAKRVSAAIFDHTNGASAGYAERLNGSTNEKFGVAKSLSVMPGDVIQLEVYAKYVDSNTNNWTGALTTLMNQVAAGTSGVVIDGATYGTSTSSFPFAGAMTTSPESGAPKAYLNWLIFDRSYVLKDFGYKGITTAAREYGQDVAHEKLAPAQDITIKEAGYVYVYTSNEETTPIEVYFDDLKVTFTKSPVVQQDDYYPYGLRFNNYSRENSVSNKYLFNSGSELQTDLDLGVYHTFFRMYDPALGRFWQPDPLADFFTGITPYSFAFNNPISYSDPDGLAPMWFLHMRASLKQAWYNVTGRGNIHAQIEGRHNGSRVQIGATTAGRRPTPNPRTEQVAKTYGKEEPTAQEEPHHDPIVSQQPEPAQPESEPRPEPTINGKPIEAGQRIRLAHKPFDYNDFAIRNSSQTNSFLTPIAEKLKSNPQLAITIQILTNLTPDQLKTNLATVHTGMTGNQLMWSRGQAIQKALLNMGVDSRQVVFMYTPGVPKENVGINIVVRSK